MKVNFLRLDAAFGGFSYKSLNSLQVHWLRFGLINIYYFNYYSMQNHTGCPKSTGVEILILYLQHSNFCTVFYAVGCLGGGGENVSFPSEKGLRWCEL